MRVGDRQDDVTAIKRYLETRIIKTTHSALIYQT